MQQPGENDRRATVAADSQPIDPAAIVRQQQAATVVGRMPPVPAQVEHAIDEFYKDQFLISSDYLANVAENIKIATGLISDAYNLRPLIAAHPLPADLRPVADQLEKTVRNQPALKPDIWIGAAAEERLGKLSRIYDLLSGLQADLNASLKNPSNAAQLRDPRQITMAVVRSDTLKKIVGIGLDVLSDNKRLGEFVSAATLAKPAGAGAGVLTFGAGDLAEGALGLAGGKHWNDADTVEKMLDGLNSGLWAAVGVLATPGDAQTKMAAGKALANAASYAAQLGRAAFLPLFIKGQGIDRALVDTYTQAQATLKAHGKAPETIETFYHNDRSLLDLIGTARRDAVDRQFGLQSPPSGSQPAWITISHTTTTEHYIETCRPYVCTRTDLTRVNETALPTKEGGVRINPVPVAIDAPPATLTTAFSSPAVRDIAAHLSSASATTGSANMRPEHDTPAPIGGIRIDPRVWLSEPLPPIRAVVVSPDTGSIVVVGDANRTSDLKPSDLLVALAVIDGDPGSEITFSLDPADPHNPRGKWLKAVYRPEWLASKAAAAVLFDSDLLLKAYGYQVTIADGKIAPRTVTLPGYKSYADLVVEATRGKALPSQWSRFWLVADKAELHTTPNAITIDVHLAVQARREIIDRKSPTGLSDVETDPNGLETQWARLMTAHLKEFNEPAWGRLEQLARAVAFCKWLRTEGVIVDRDQIARLVNQEQTRNIAKITALDIVRRSEHREPLKNGRGERIIRSELHLFGGVDLDLKPSRVPDTGEARSIAGSVMQELHRNPSETVFMINQGGETLRGVVIPILARTSPTVALTPQR